MGVLSDIVVASEAEASSVLNAEHGARPWPWADMKGIDPVKLARLEAAFRGGPYDEDFIGACNTLAATDDESCWVFRIPAVLTDALARAEPDSVVSVAKEWAKAEEFGLDGWQLEDVERALIEIARLARLARTTGKDLLLWMSL